MQATNNTFPSTNFVRQTLQCPLQTPMPVLPTDVNRIPPTLIDPTIQNDSQTAEDVEYGPPLPPYLSDGNKNAPNTFAMPPPPLPKSPPPTYVAGGSLVPRSSLHNNLPDKESSENNYPDVSQLTTIIPYRDLKKPVGNVGDQVKDFSQYEQLEDGEIVEEDDDDDKDLKFQEHTKGQRFEEQLENSKFKGYYKTPGFKEYSKDSRHKEYSKDERLYEYSRYNKPKEHSKYTKHKELSKDSRFKRHSKDPRFKGHSIDPSIKEYLKDPKVKKKSKGTGLEEHLKDSRIREDFKDQRLKEHIKDPSLKEHMNDLRPKEHFSDSRMKEHLKDQKLREYPQNPKLKDYSKYLKHDEYSKERRLKDHFKDPNKNYPKESNLNEASNVLKLADHSKDSRHKHHSKDPRLRGHSKDASLKRHMKDPDVDDHALEPKHYEHLIDPKHYEQLKDPRIYQQLKDLINEQLQNPKFKQLKDSDTEDHSKDARLQKHFKDPNLKEHSESAKEGQSKDRLKEHCKIENNADIPNNTSSKLPVKELKSPSEKELLKDPRLTKQTRDLSLQEQSNKPILKEKLKDTTLLQQTRDVTDVSNDPEHSKQPSLLKLRKTVEKPLLTFDSSQQKSNVSSQTTTSTVSSSNVNTDVKKKEFCEKKENSVADNLFEDSKNMACKNISRLSNKLSEHVDSHSVSEHSLPYKFIANQINHDDNASCVVPENEYTSENDQMYIVEEDSIKEDHSSSDSIKFASESLKSNLVKNKSCYRSRSESQEKTKNENFSEGKNVTTSSIKLDDNASKSNSNQIESHHLSRSKSESKKKKACFSKPNTYPSKSNVSKSKSHSYSKSVSSSTTQERKTKRSLESNIENVPSDHFAASSIRLDVIPPKSNSEKSRSHHHYRSRSTSKEKSKTEHLSYSDIDQLKAHHSKVTSLKLDNESLKYTPVQNKSYDHSRSAIKEKRVREHDLSNSTERLEAYHSTDGSLKLNFISSKSVSSQNKSQYPSRSRSLSKAKDNVTHVLVADNEGIKPDTSLSGCTKMDSKSPKSSSTTNNPHSHSRSRSRCKSTETRINENFKEKQIGKEKSHRSDLKSVEKDKDSSFKVHSVRKDSKSISRNSKDKSPSRSRSKSQLDEKLMHCTIKKSSMVRSSSKERPPSIPTMKRSRSRSLSRGKSKSPRLYSDHKKSNSSTNQTVSTNEMIDSISETSGRNQVKKCDEKKRSSSVYSDRYQRSSSVYSDRNRRSSSVYSKRSSYMPHHQRIRSRKDRREIQEDQPLLSTEPSKNIVSSPSESFYVQTNKGSDEIVATDALLALHEKFKFELVDRAARAKALKPKYEPPVRKVKLRKLKIKEQSNSSSSSEDLSSSEEEDTTIEELERKRKHPDRLHPELWFNDPKEMNDGPLCRCSAKASRAGIRHGIYVGEEPIPPCNPYSNNADKLWHYKITMTPHTNFMTKCPTKIIHKENKYIFEGFSMFSHYPLPPLPSCKVIRFNYEYTILYVEEPKPQNFTIAGLELFNKFLLEEILELVDINWRAHNDPTGCPRFHFMPRFARELDDNSKELLSLDAVLEYLLACNKILIDEKKLNVVMKYSEGKWQDLADEVKGMIVTCPGMKPSSVRVDQLDREDHGKEKTNFPIIVHFGVRPPQLSYAGNPLYQKAWRDYVKYRHLLANKPKVRYEDRRKLVSKESKLQEMRMENDLKRDVTVVISSKGFYRTGLMSDVIQHAMLMPVLVCHLRFHHSLINLEERIKYKFKDRFLLQLALTHPSYRENFGTNPDHARNSLTNCGLRQPQYGDRRIHYMNTRKRGINTLINIMSRFGCQKESASSINHNERLEFLGDAVVEFLSSIHLFYMFPELEEGGLATYRAAIVQNQHLAVLAKKLQLEKYMLYAHGSDLCHDLELRHAMANCFEALMGALFLDNGIEVADRVFSETLFPESDLQEVWKNYPLHPLQEQEPEGDRKWISSVPLLQRLHEFEEKIGIEFNHIRLLARALTHRSLGYNNLTLGSNQRLEFLGDTVLQLVASEYLYKFFPHHHEGHLSLLRSSLVNNRTQAVVCIDLGMVEYAIYPYNKLELKPKDKADLLEAFLGALYIDKDLGYCKKFCEVCFFPRLQDFIMNQDWNDPKSKLQQCCLTLRSMDGGEPDIPTYKVIECKGPTNTRVYSVAVYFQGNRLAVGTGHSIQQAEMDAAANALRKSKDLFPQLRHQKRAIERSLKHGRRPTKCRKK